MPWKVRRRNCKQASGKPGKVYCCQSKAWRQRRKRVLPYKAKIKHRPLLEHDMPMNPYRKLTLKKGSGKKPKGSGRRLYTDEDPSDTVSVKFRTVQDIKDTLSKSSFKSKSHKRQSQIINLIHQRARAAYQNAKDPEVKARLKKAYDYAAERKEASKKKTQQKNKK